MLMKSFLVVGNATRPCLLVDLVPVWGQPDLSGCVSKLFADIFSEVSQYTWHYNKT